MRKRFTEDLPNQDPEPEDTGNALTVQPDFFDDGSLGVELASLDKPETKHGKYTGEELAKRTELRDAVIKLHVQGVGVRRMARELRASGIKIGETSILKMLRLVPDLVATEKKRVSDTLGSIITLMTDSIKERLIDGSMKPSSVDVAIMIDKKAGIDGEAGLIVEHRITLPSAEDFTKRLEEMKRAKVIGEPIDCEATAIPEKPQ